MKRLPLLVLILLLGPHTLSQARADTGAMRFVEGQEAAVLDLLKPHTDEDLVIGAWSLSSLVVGPPCELKAGFQTAGKGEEVLVIVTPAPGGEGSFAYSWEPRRPDELGEGFEALLRGNDPGDFFKTRCMIPVTNENENATVEGVDPAVLASMNYTLPIVIIGALAILLVIGLFLRRKQKKQAPKPVK